MIRVRKIYFLPLSQLLQWPEAQIGQLGYQLGKLVSSQVPIVPGFVVPVSTLEKIAEDNHLDLKLQQWLQTTYLNQTLTSEAVHEQLLEIFLSLKVASGISEQFFEHFYQEIKTKKVVWTASWIAPHHAHLPVESETLSGDATVFEGMLEIWAHSVWTGLLNSSATTKFKPQNLTPAALLLQSFQKPQTSGFVLTNLDGEPKSIYGVFGPENTQVPIYKIDVRTWQILQKQTPQNVPEAIALEVTQAANRAKLHDFNHLRVSWELVGKQVFITNVERLNVIQSLPPSLTPLNLLVLGHSIIRGKVNGEVVLLKSQPDPRQKFENSILVLPELLKVTATNLKDVLGVIVDEGLSLSAQAVLRAHHVPTLSHTKNATKKLTSKQFVTLDTTQGKVFAAISVQIPPVAPLVSRRTHLMATTALPLPEKTTHLPPIQGVLVDGNQLWSDLGSHPQYVLKTTLQQELKSRLKQVLSSYQPLPQLLLYRPNTLDTYQQLALDHGHDYTQREINPQLGYFGALKLLQEPQTLQLELRIITKLQNTQHPISLVAPLTRNSQEFHQLLKLYRHHLPADTPIWWEIAYPENVFNLSTYALRDGQQVMVNLQHLYSLLIGLDATAQDLTIRYPLDIDLVRTVLQHLIALIPAQHIWLQTSPREYQNLSALAVELGLGGIIGPVGDTATMHHQLQIAEHHWLTSRKTIH